VYTKTGVIMPVDSASQTDGRLRAQSEQKAEWRQKFATMNIVTRANRVFLLALKKWGKGLEFLTYATADKI